MIDRVRRGLSYANVMATLAVFIALGGTSLAALQVTGRDIKDSSLTARDLRPETLGGKRIKESRLGVVPRARNADRLNGVTAARLLVRCPTATVPVSDVCVEEAARVPLRTELLPERAKPWTDDKRRGGAFRATTSS